MEKVPGGLHASGCAEIRSPCGEVRSPRGLDTKGAVGQQVLKSGSEKRDRLDTGWVHCIEIMVI
jgi:hypothetical protein